MKIAILPFRDIENHPYKGGRNCLFQCRRALDWLRELNYLLDAQ